MKHQKQFILYIVEPNKMCLVLFGHLFIILGDLGGIKTYISQEIKCILNSY